MIMISYLFSNNNTSIQIFCFCLKLFHDNFLINAKTASASNRNASLIAYNICEERNVLHKNYSTSIFISG